MNVLYDFIIEFVAAFLGFLFAILFAGISSKIENKKKQKMLLKNIHNELKDIHDSIKEYEDNNALLRHRIAVPTWDALQYSGGVMDLIGESYYDELLTAYSSIKMFNDERREMSDKEIKKIMEEILESSHNVLTQIEKDL
ncbi:MAG: hypothetical protein K6G75_09065 [Lachnospiraceae bacterium]|nr:hypothetical protein [Lachnospiraceae bacterium]